ncbi:type II toxin-antitoxin system VapC family toxin [Terrarubrum flagellatum]|uniref:type II toxin-antitoxin system VapC family toxin n=1 Tax=Terrirubrum flagellatum TaxID=2895980 RepID=UPI0031451575
MKITADMNLLVRALAGDHPTQSRIAQAELGKAELVALTLPTLCELVRVLSRGYRIPVPEISEAIRRLINAGNVATDRPAAEAGLALMEAGGDFADGVIAYSGSFLGAECLVSFDKDAVKLLKARGVAARAPSAA